MKRVLITGANSYIGMSFEKYICKNYSSDFIVDTVDMLDKSWIDKDFSGYDAVFHVAGIAHIKETKENEHLYYEVNKDLAISVAKKAIASGIKHFIYLSSMAVYGINSGRFSYDSECYPVSAYGKSKYEAEKELSKIYTGDSKLAIIRPPMVYGPGCKGNYNLLSKFACRFKIFPKIINYRDMIYIDNLCEFVVMAIASEFSGMAIPKNKEPVCVKDMVNEICEINGHKLHTIGILNPFVKLLRKLSVSFAKVFGDYICDTKDVFGYKYCVADFKDTIKRT